jgi:hypothetical protein
MPTNVSELFSKFQILILKVVGEASDAKSGPDGDLTTLSHNGATSSFSKAASNTSSSASRFSGKRQRDDGGDDGEDDNRNNGNKRLPRTPKAALSVSRKFACPYYKRDSENCHKWRSCSGPGWDTVHRVKYYTLITLLLCLILTHAENTFIDAMLYPLDAVAVAQCSRLMLD